MHLKKHEKRWKCCQIFFIAFTTVTAGLFTNTTDLSFLPLFPCPLLVPVQLLPVSAVLVFILAKGCNEMLCLEGGF